MKNSNFFFLYKSDFHILSLVVFTIIVYYPTFTNDFLYMWDDQWQVYTVTTEGGFTWENISAIFTQSFYNQYFPVNQFFYMLIYAIFEDYNATAFHSFGLVLHLINIFLVYYLFIKILTVSGRMDKDRIKPVSFLTALLFAVHPLNVESVAWISASKILLYSLFYLLSLYVYILYCETQKSKYFLISLFVFLISFGCKEQAVILPLCLLVLDWFLMRDLKNKKLWLEKFPFFLFALLMGGFTIYLGHDMFLFGAENYSIFDRIIFCCYSYLEYLFKWILPFNLLYLYPFPSPPGEPMPEWLYLYPILVLIICFSFMKLFVDKWVISLGLLFFIINLLLTTHLIPMPRFAIVADRYIYLSSVGLSFIFSYYFLEFLMIFQKRKNIILVLFMSYILYFGIYSNFRVRIWHDSDTLKERVRELLDYRESCFLIKEVK